MRLSPLQTRSTWRNQFQGTTKNEKPDDNTFVNGSIEDPQKLADGNEF